MYWKLQEQAAERITVYQQSPLQADVWDTLHGDKDDFLVYDRCGQLTFHIMLPFSFLHYPYVEAAIRATYHRDICNCTLNSNSSLSANNSNLTTGSGQNTTTEEPQQSNHNHHHHQHHHHHSNHPSFETRNVDSTKLQKHTHHNTHNTEHDHAMAHKHKHQPEES